MFEPVFVETNAAVGECQPLALGLGGGEVASAAGEGGARADQFHWQAVASVFFNDFGSGVGGSAVGDDDLVRRACLRDQAVQQLADRVFFVSNGNDNADFHS